MDYQTPQVCTEFTFLMLCCKSKLTKEDKYLIHTTLKHNTLNIEKLIALAYRHAVFSQLYKTLKQFTIAYPLLTILKPYYMRIVQRNIAMTVELIRLHTLLEKNQISSLSFKGATLAHIAYGDITLRQYGDIDILIHKKDAHRAVSLLAHEGYSPEIPLNAKLKRTLINTLNVLGFLNPSEDILVEVHWELLSKNYAITWDTQALWECVSNTTLNNHTLQTLSIEHTLLYLCTHGSKHLYGQLSWVCDIDKLLYSHTTIAWEEIMHSSKKMGIYRMVLFSLALCQKILDTPLPKVIEDAIKKEKKVPFLVKSITDLHFNHIPKEGKTYRAFYLLWHMRENTLDKMRFAYYALFHPKLDDFRSLTLPSSLSFLYPIVRPFRLLWKYIK